MEAGSKDAAPPARKLPWWWRFTLSLAPLFLLLVLAEVTLRVVGYKPLAGVVDEGLPLVRVSDDHDVFYELTPGFAGFGFGTEVRINSQGFRDREYELEKPDGVFRIVVVGDSNTFGNGLPREAIYTEQMERRLANENVEVLNLGVGGYDTLNEVALLEERGLRFDPDLVIVGYSMNDAGVHTTTLGHIRRLPRFESPFFRLRLVQFVAVHLEWIEFALEGTDVNLEENFRERYAHRMRDVSEDAEVAADIAELQEFLEKEPQRLLLPDYTTPDRIGRLRYAFEWFQRLGRAHDFPVILVSIPHPPEFKSAAGWEIARRLVAREAERAGIQVIPVHEYFYGLDRETYRQKNNVHLTEKAHTVMADLILERLAPRYGWHPDPD